MPFSIPFTSSAFKKSNTDLRVDIPPQMANGMQAYNGNTNGARNSPTPFIKNEPQDDTARFQSFSQHPDAYSMSANPHFQTQHGGFSDADFGGNDSVDPSQLTVQTGGFNFPAYSSSQGGLGFMNGGGALSIGDDDLRAGLQEDFLDGLESGDTRENGQDVFSYNELNRHRKNGNGVPTSQSYSHTPENPPAGSPFIRGFPQDQYQRLYKGPGDSPSSYQQSPLIGSGSTGHFDGFMAHKRKDGPGRSERSPSAMSPRTPNTPGLHGLSIVGAESMSLPGQPIHMRHQKTLSNPWDATPGSSYLDSPLSSPGIHIHASIPEVFKGKGASLPAKVDHMSGNSQEAKKRRRRESHNLVERRRRDNINERIQDLAQLVPHHRLEDEKVRKQLLNSGSLSPTAGASGSPPRATSMLAVGPGGVGRRAVASTGLTGEEKDKGPNKGDILNGAVGWTRDLMWAMQVKLEQEKQVRELVESLGRTYPFEQSEAERRMASELDAAIAKAKRENHNFGYSRAPGTGLRVPGFTDYAGQPLHGDGSDRVSPATSSGKSMQSGSSRGTPQKYWNDGIVLKEEEEEYMDMS
ncbi:hypothetical protein FN846DRAFT_261753 [Sphaerosporella brunnea]|uniref:BHLH domain-containing protein n=1 Tax=Sphaerosporella brunnea TaxID=1250544 RepID=A0A5J5ENH4_9PEZI|nr:hypothetical protein FN846DRAFT_262539 [Sphaerosporella brunnea]KAA8897228.1 hypothetical protein FN846DRAFT_261753 [Sphaerosporella brunnea]